MRAVTVLVLIAVVLAVPPAALAQESVSRAASDLPTTLFEPAPDGVPAGADLTDEGGGAPLLVGLVLVAAAAAIGYLAGSSSSTRRS